MDEMEKVKEKKVGPKREFIVLTEAASTKLSRWMDQVNAKKKIKASRKAFLCWYIENAPENLSTKDMSAAIGKFYKTSNYLRQLLREVKQAEADGISENDIEIIVKSRKSESGKERDETPE
jgi:hypothetical protein